jgi:signal transduction histidine kinase
MTPGEPATESPRSAGVRERGRILLASVGIMALVFAGVAAVVIDALYAAAFDEQRARLSEQVQSRARLIGAIASFYARFSREAMPGGASAATLSQIAEAHESFAGLGETGEFQLARRDGDRMVLLLSRRHASRESADTIPLDSELAEPMRRALRGESGVIVARDYRGAEVLAAYDSVAELGWGLVAKIDLAEIRAPFIRAALAAGAIALLISGTGILLIARLMSMLLRSVGERSRQLEREITERRQAEEALRRSEEHLREAQKLEAVGYLASGIAHDFNNLITVISASCAALRSHFEDEDSGQAELDRIQQASVQAIHVTRSLLAFSRKLPVEKHPVCLQTIVDETTHLIRHLLPPGVELIVDRFDAPEVWVNSDRTQLQQVLLNLGINARDAMPFGGKLRVSLSTAREGEASGPAAALDVPSGFARITVADTGVGIPRELTARIFEPLFTTKARGAGTGLGLSIVHGIVTEHGGRIEVESETGRGTSFSVYLPRVAAPSTRQWKAPDVGPEGKGELILLAEGHEQVRAALASTLESLGYEVVQAADGEALLECVAKHRAAIELLVVELDLPKRNGLECLAELRGAGVRVPAVLITRSDVDRIDERLGPEDVLLRKPFEMHGFSEVVTRVLASCGAKDLAS